MLFAPNPGILAAGVSTDAAYEQWLALEDAKPFTSLAWLSAPAWGSGTFRTICADPTGAPMTGSPWLDRFRGTSGLTAPARVVQHSMPDFATFSQQVSLGRAVFFDVEVGANAPFIAVDRNGFLSAPGSGSASARVISQMRFYHPALGPVFMKPVDGLGPTPY